MELNSLFEEIEVEEFYGEQIEEVVSEIVTVSLDDDETPDFLKAA